MNEFPWQLSHQMIRLGDDVIESLCIPDGRIRELETELVRANELLEVMKKKAPSYISEEDAQAISPAAAAASRLLKSGMTLTQVSGLKMMLHREELNVCSSEFDAFCEICSFIQISFL